MSSEELKTPINIIFSYNKKSYDIQHTNEGNMSAIFKKFITKIKSDIINFDFFHNGNLINGDTQVSKLINKRNEIIVHAQEIVKIIKCPLCICNDCILNIDNYILFFSGCKYNHNAYKLFEEYNNSQKIDYAQINCGNSRCPQNNKEGDYYKCLNCTQLNHRTKYFCQECNDNHKEKFGHVTVEYDKKNYYCENHYQGKDICNKFIKYCEECKKDLCEKCDIDHRDHKIIPYSTIEKDDKEIDKFKENLDNMKAKINDIKVIVEDIKDSLDGAMKLIEKYHEIASDIIRKYELYNKELKNYRILKTIKNLENSNSKMIKDLDKIIKEKDTKKRMDILIDIYLNERKIFIKGNPNIFNNTTQKGSTVKKGDISFDKKISSKDNSSSINPVNDNGKKLITNLI